MTIVIIFWYMVIVLLCLYYMVLAITWKKMETTSSHNEQSLPVTVMICAKNEAKHLQQYLPAILEQQYHEFEVLIIDDQSTDATKEIIHQLAQQYSNLRIERPDKQKTGLLGKKGLISLGIQMAKYKHILFTDADCQVSSRHWIASMASHCIEDTRFVLGYAPIQTEKGWLGAYEQFENTKTAATYMAHAALGRPYMGVGRNLLYVHEKEDLIEIYREGGNELSGDDDLLVNQLANSRNTQFNISSESWMISKAPATWKSLLLQKTRQLRVGGYYKLVDKMMLGMILFFEAYGIMLLIIFALLNLLSYWMILIYMVKFALKGWMYFQVDKKLNTAIRGWYTCFDILHIFLSAMLYVRGLVVKNKIVWK